MRRFCRQFAAGILIAVVVGACGGDSNDSADATSNDIAGSLKEWVLEVDATTAKAGDVTFTITNTGTIGHEFLVVKTDIENGKIPLAGDHFEEPSAGLEVIDEIGEFPAGETNELTVTLEPGNYQLVCNLPSHYGAGMHMTFTVLA